jgi:hypothetical protein
MKMMSAPGSVDDGFPEGLEVFFIHALHAEGLFSVRCGN